MIEFDVGLVENPTSLGLQTLSVNHFKTWHKCQKRFQLDYVNQLFWPTDQRRFQFGQEVHKLMDYASKDFDMAGVLRFASPTVLKAYQLIQDHPIAQETILASEWAFEVPLQTDPQTFLVGRMDRVSLTDAGLIRVIDWKTGTAIPKQPAQDWQTLVYLYAAYSARDILGYADYAPNQLVMTYVSVTERIETVDVMFAQETFVDTEQRLIRSGQAILSAAQFNLPPACPDKHCPYRKICGIETPAA